MIAPKVLSTAPKSLTKRDRLTLHDRQGGICPWCGQHVDVEAMHAHHRLLRSAGGTWALSNILGLHGWCHNVQPGSVHQEPKRSYGLGFMLRRSLMQPSEIPFYVRWAAEWWLPDADGGKTIIHASLALELIAAAGGLSRAGVTS